MAISKIINDGITAVTIDASGNVGINRTSPNGLLHMQSPSGTDSALYIQTNAATDDSVIHFGDDSASSVGSILYDHSTNSMQFETNATERMRIDSSGRVLIGRTTATLGGGNGSNLQIGSGTTGAGLTIHTGASSLGDIQFADGTTGADSYRGLLRYDHSNNSMAFWTNATERMRIDSSGNLLVGQASADNTTAGVSARSDGRLFATRDSDQPAFFNRLTNDGTIIEMAKDSSLIGQIGVISSRPYIATAYGSDSGLRFDSAFIAPCTTTGSGRDNAIDLGSSGNRFDDIYATNGTIQTSDQNEKQQIASLTDAEITAAKAISKLFKTFKWNDKVEAKGDAARTHTGIIAQDVQQAMTDAGLDAGDYAFFISTTWWETQTEVPAVEADEENDIEAADAYTRTDTYETADEAPEGATERTRLGIRYPELLAFIGAATEQRLADIETRLTALEAN